MRKKVEKIRQNTMKKHRNFLYIHQESERNLNVNWGDGIFSDQSQLNMAGYERS
jgi:hypothetical protein